MLIQQTKCLQEISPEAVPYDYCSLVLAQTLYDADMVADADRIVPACFLLLAACTWLLVRRCGGAMPTSAARAVAAAIGVANGAQFAVIVSRPLPGWDSQTTQRALSFI